MVSKVGDSDSPLLRGGDYHCSCDVYHRTQKSALHVLQKIVTGRLLHYGTAYLTRYFVATYGSQQYSGQERPDVAKYVATSVHLDDLRTAMLISF